MCVSTVSVHAISFLDPGPHGSGRYSPEMFPEIEQRDFRKGAQVHLCCITSVFCKKTQFISELWSDPVFSRKVIVGVLVDLECNVTMQDIYAVLSCGRS
jgi:hypothetical protein